MRTKEQSDKMKRKYENILQEILTGKLFQRANNLD